MKSLECSAGLERRRVLLKTFAQKFSLKVRCSCFKIFYIGFLKNFFQSINEEPDRHILEVGIGFGDKTSAMSDHIKDPKKLYGIDIDPERIKEAQRKYLEIKLDYANAINLPYPDQLMTAVCFCQSTHYLSSDDLEKALQEASRVLKSNGKLLIIETFKFRRKILDLLLIPLRQLYQYTFGAGEYYNITEEEFLAVADQQGFSLQENMKESHWLYSILISNTLIFDKKS